MENNYEVTEDLYSDDEKEWENYRRMTHRQDGRIHRDDDLPAVQIYKPNSDEIVREEWWLYGRLHREDNPAIQYYRTTREGMTVLSDQKWYRGGQLSRDDAPAVIERDGDTIYHEGWWQNDQRHRIGAPAESWFDVNTGVVLLEQWFRYNQLDRNEGAAVIERHHETGAVIHEEFFRKGQQFTSDGRPVIKADLKFTLT